jgi:hypothetical protein
MAITQEEKDKLLKQQHFWYSQIFVLFQLIFQLKNRELALLNSKVEESHIATRFLYATSIDYLKSHLEALGVSKGTKLINLYRSNAIFKDNAIPVSSYNLKIRTNEENYIEFNKQFSERAKGFDFIIDIDTKTIQKAYEIAEEVKALFDERKLPYSLKFSGTRGFHFIIDDEFLPQMEIFEKIGMIRKILINLVDIYDWKDEEGKDAIDISVTNLKGLIKLAYSFDSGNIALPLSDEQFNNFKIENMKMENVLKHIFIKNRGLLTRIYNLSEEQLKENTKKFFEEFDF